MRNQLSAKARLRQKMRNVWPNNWQIITAAIFGLFLLILQFYSQDIGLLATIAVSIIIGLPIAASMIGQRKEKTIRQRGRKKFTFQSIVIIDPQNNRFVDADQNAQFLFDYDLESMLQLGLVDLSPHTQASGISSKKLAEENIRKAIEGSSPSFEWIAINSSGHPIACELSLKKVSSNGKMLIRASIHDMRDQKRIKKESDGQNGSQTHSTDELAGLAIASASISSSLELDKVLQVVAKQFTNLLDVQICLISDWNDSEKTLTTRLEYVSTMHGARVARHKPSTVVNQIELPNILEKQRPFQLHATNGISPEQGKLMRDAKISSLLALPLLANGRPIGLIELQDKRERYLFSEHELYLAQTLCQQAANAIENAQLFISTQRQVTELKILNDVASACTEASDEDELISQATRIIQENLFPDNFGVLLISPDMQELFIHPSYRAESGIKEKRIPLGEGVSGRVAQNGVAIRVADTSQEIEYLKYDPSAKSELCVPMKVGKKVIGVINAESNSLGHFSLDDERLLVTFANQLGGGIGRIRNEETQKRKSRQLKVFNQLSGKLAGILGRGKLFQSVVEHLDKHMDYLGAYIFSVHEENEYMQLEAFHGANPIPDNGATYVQAIDQGLLGKAYREKKIVVANFAREDEDYIEIKGLEKVQSEVIIPITVYKKISALLVINREGVDTFDDDEIAALKTLADHISISLESIDLFDATRRQLQELTVLHAITNAAVSAKTENELLERATEIIGASLYPDKFGFLLLDKDKDHLRVHPSYRGINKTAAGVRVPLNKGISGQVATSGKPRRIPDVRKEPRYLNVNPTMRSELTVPLTGSHEVLGVINAESAELDAFTDSDMRLLSTIAGQLGTAMEKLRLFEAEKLQRGQAETLQEVAAILGGAQDISEISDLILEQLNLVVPFDSASIQIVEGDHFVIKAVGGKLSKNVVGNKLAIKEDKIAHPMLEEQRTVLIGDISKHPDWLKAPGIKKVKSWIGAPLIVRGNCIGVLTVDGYRKDQFTEADGQLVSSFAIHAGIAIENARLFTELEETYSQTVSALANAIEARDSYTNGHSQRLSTLAVETGRILHCEGKAIDDIYWGALLHDIGKIGVPDHILRKPSSLTESEFEIIRQHPEIGEGIIEPIKKLAHLAPIIRSHQERHDGKGYPDALRGNDIPLASRIISVADAYGAMIDNRVYHAARSREEALSEIKRCSGSQFDPEVVDAFLIAVKNSPNDNGRQY